MAFEIVSTLIWAFTLLDYVTLLPQHRFNSTLSTGSAIEIGGIALVEGATRFAFLPRSMEGRSAFTPITGVSTAALATLNVREDI